MYILAASNLLADLFEIAKAYLLLFLTGIIITLILWGFMWDRILSKAGFLGKAYWRIYVMLMSPAVVLIFGVLFTPSSRLSSEPPPLIKVLGTLSFFLAYIGMNIVAFAPWPVRKDLKRLREAQKIAEPKTEPSGITSLPLKFLNWLKKIIF